MELFSPKTEEKILEFWKRERVFEKSVKNRAGKKTFVFYEGPPSANGRPGIHHILARVYKDLICRYKTMAGFRVPRKAGWDTHGLPIELQVEKELKLKNKKDIEKYGVGRFNEKARETVWKYKEEWDRLTERVGFWLDLKNPYITYEPEYIESLWHILSLIYKKKLLYRDFKVVPYCPRCGTALSSHEVAQGYEKVSENSVYVKFRLKPGQEIKTEKGKFSVGKNVFVLSWTTTPWTLPGNEALAVGVKIKYEILTLENGEVLIFAADREKDINIEGMKKASEFAAGKNLVGLAYEPLFDAPKLKSKTSFKIYAADFVNTEEGTGIVHIAPMYGVDDFNLGAKAGLPKIHTVDLDGKFTEDCGAGSKGFSAKSSEAENKIVECLKAAGNLLKIKKYEHDYPFCWRCRSALLYYAKSSWFIAMEKLRAKLIANNQKINWIPAHIKYGRFGEWLNEIKDWAVSRERYWGTPLPIWRCEKCGKETAVGSLAELDKLSAQKLKKGEHNWPVNEKMELDLHRPYVDGVFLKCKKCGGKMERVKDVVDVWFDSGAMPFAQAHWPFEKNKKIDFKNPEAANYKFEYPADFVCEGIDQTRGWFYTLHAVGALLGKGEAYKNVISLGHVLDEKGEKMSKSRGNVVEPAAIIEKYGADALRWYFFTINPPGESKLFAARDVEERLRRFVLTLSNVLVFYRTYSSENPKLKIQSLKLGSLDRWILSRLNQTVKTVGKNLDKYEITQAARTVDGFVDDLSRWWLRRSRQRFSGAGGETASAVLKFILEEAAKLVAPFTPFLAEYIWSESGGKESVHLQDYPKASIKMIDAELEKRMDSARKIAAEGLALRAAAGIKVRQPLASLKIRDEKIKNETELIDLIKDELNVKEIIFDKRLGSALELDTKITAALKEDGLIRELARQIQGMRKDAGLTPKDAIKIYFAATDKNLEAVIQKRAGELKNETGARIVEFINAPEDGLLVDRHFEIENQKIWIGIIKI